MNRNRRKKRDNFTCCFNGTWSVSLREDYLLWIFENNTWKQEGGNDRMLEETVHKELHNLRGTPYRTNITLG
jgi:hypothetical protein